MGCLADDRNILESKMKVYFLQPNYIIYKHSILFLQQHELDIPSLKTWVMHRKSFSGLCKALRLCCRTYPSHALLLTHQHCTLVLQLLYFLDTTWWATERPLADCLQILHPEVWKLETDSSFHEVQADSTTSLLGPPIFQSPSCSISNHSPCGYH